MADETRRREMKVGDRVMQTAGIFDPSSRQGDLVGTVTNAMLNIDEWLIDVKFDARDEVTICLPASNFTIIGKN